MKILYITHYTDMYGANKALMEIAEDVAARQDNQVLAIVPAEGELSDALTKMGVRVIYSGITTWQAVYAGAIRFFVKKLIRKRKIQKEFKYLLNTLKDEHIDIIHSNSSVIGTGAFLAEALKCKHVWHIREFSEEHFGMKYFYGMDKVRKYYESADRIIAISGALEDNYKNRYKNASVQCIYDGVKNKDYPVRVYEKKDRLSLCYTGYVFPKKHQLEVALMCKELIDEGFNSFDMYFFGEGNKPYFESVKKYIEDNNLSEQVHLCGYVKNADERLSTMDVGIIASEYEAFGRVTVEYMLSGLPVIGYRDCGNEEIIVDGETGFLYESGAEFKAFVKKMMDEKLREKLGSAGRERALCNFVSDKNSEAVLGLYDKLMKD